MCVCVSSSQWVVSSSSSSLWCWLLLSWLPLTPCCAVLSSQSVTGRRSDNVVCSRGGYTGQSFEGRGGYTASRFISNSSNTNVTASLRCNQTFRNTHQSDVGVGQPLVVHQLEDSPVVVKSSANPFTRSRDVLYL